MFLEPPKSHFVPSSRPPAINLTRKDTATVLERHYALCDVLLFSKIKNVFSYISRGQDRMKLLVFALHLWLKRLRRIHNDKYDNKYNNTNMKKNNKCNTRSNRI